MQSFDRLFLKYYQSLFLYANKFVSDHDEAHNLVQDVFTRIYEKRIYERDQDYLKHYLFNAVRNACFNHYKHQKVISKHYSKAQMEMREMEINHFSIERSIIEKEIFQKIHEAIGELPEQQKEVILLSRFEGLKNKEIADRLQIPVRTVETRIYRALAALKQKLEAQVFLILFHGLITGSCFHRPATSVNIVPN